MKIQNRAISIRQPYVDEIFEGYKKIEYRSKPTKIRGRVYIYASKYDEESNDGKLRGVIVGSVEIVDCKYNETFEEYEWMLADPVLLKTPKKPKGKPQPVWFKPF